MCSGPREGCLCWAGRDADVGHCANPRSLILFTHAPPAYPSHLLPSPRHPSLLGPHPCSRPARWPVPLLPSCLPLSLGLPSPHPIPREPCCQPQPSTLLVLRASLLQTVSGQLDLLVSACAVGVGCCFAAPVGGKSHFLPTPFPEHDLEGGWSGCLTFGVERVLANGTSGWAFKE